MTNNEKVRDIAQQSSRGNGTVAGVGAVGVAVVLRDGREPGWGGLEEVGNQLRFAVLLSLHGTFFSDDGAVIVGGVAAWVAKVAYLMSASH